MPDLIKGPEQAKFPDVQYLETPCRFGSIVLYVAMYSKLHFLKSQQEPHKFSIFTLTLNDFRKFLWHAFLNGPKNNKSNLPYFFSNLSALLSALIPTTSSSTSSFSSTSSIIPRTSRTTSLNATSTSRDATILHNFWQHFKLFGCFCTKNEAFFTN